MGVPDNLDAFNRHDAEQEEKSDRLPVCAYCDEPIQTDKLYLIDDEFVCPGCLNNYFKRDTDDFIKE